MNTMALARIIAFALLTAVPAVGITSSASAATPEAKDTKLSIKVTVEHEGAKLAAKSISSVGETASLRTADEDHAHDLSVTVVSQSDEGFALKIGYARDGRRIVESKDYEVSGKSLTLEAGGSTITLSLAPAKPKRTRIEVPEGDDPLAGL